MSLAARKVRWGEVALPPRGRGIVHPVPDDERSRRRLGDETRAKIADLASGWTVDPEPEPEPPPRPTATPRPAPTRPAPTAPPPVAAPVTRPAPTAPPPVAAPATSPPRTKPRTLPPPPPGSAARAALESAIVEAAATPAPARTQPPSAPPAPSPARAAAKPSSPPPVPPRRATIATNAVAGTIGGDTGAFVVGDHVATLRPRAPTSDPGRDALVDRPTERDLERPPEAPTDRPPERELAPPSEAAPGAPIVPRGEFDDSSTSVEQDKLRIGHAQATIKRDAANALLGIPEPPLTQVKPTPVEVLLTESAAHLRDDPTSLDPATVKFERGDPTQLGRPDATEASAESPRRSAGGRLRTVATLRRQRGVLGDVRYVVTATRGVRSARRELEALEAQQTSRQQERRKYMVVLGRTAVTSDAFDHPALGPAREQLATIEDERARHHGQVVAADQELERVKRDRERHAAQYATDLAAVDAELAELARRLEPLQKEHAAVTRRAAELRDSLRRIDAQIADTTACLVAVKGPKQDPAAIHAELATLKADRLAVQRDEPRLAAELDALSPRIAAIEAKRAESQKRRTELVTTEEDDQRRTEELLAAIGAKRKVMDRAASDAEALRDKILFELGERLYVDRPASLAAQLAPIDAIDVELGTGDRRVMELKEILGSIDRAKLARGVALLIVILAAVGSFTAWVLYRLG